MLTKMCSLTVMNYSPCRDDLFGNGIGGQVRAQAQQVRGGGIGRFHAHKGERPGAGHRIGMIGHQPATLLEQGGAVPLVELLVVGEAAAHLFQIGPRLVQRQGQSLQRLRDLQSQGLIAAGRLRQFNIRGQQCGAAQQEQRPVLGRERLDDLSSQPGGSCQ